jgi:hypothetical protein
VAGRFQTEADVCAGYDVGLAGAGGWVEEDGELDVLLCEDGAHDHGGCWKVGGR